MNCRRTWNPSRYARGGCPTPPGLARERRAARSRLYSLDPAPLREVERWLEHYRVVEAAERRDAPSSSGELSHWFAQQTEVSVEAGGSYRFWGKHTLGAPAGPDAAQRMIRLDPGRALAFNWAIHKELIVDHWRFAFGNLAAHLAGGRGIVLPDYTDPAPEVRLTIEVEAPHEAVFRALIDPELVNQWFGQGSTIVDPRPRGRYDLGWKGRSSAASLRSA